MFLLYTPIFYINGSPHAGHKYTLHITHCVNRVCYLLGYSCDIATGVDEHGDKLFEEYKKIKKELNLSNYSSYIDHKRNIFIDSLFKYFKIDQFFCTYTRTHDYFTNKVIQLLKHKKIIYSGNYEGKINTNTMTYVSDYEYKLLDENQKSNIKNISESGLYIKLEDETIKEKIINNISINKEYLEYARDIIKNAKDIFITRIRDKESIEHSCTIFEDHKLTEPTEHVVYVWFDAILYYLEIYLLYNRSNVHPVIFIGKDILRFHVSLLSHICHHIIGYMPFQIIVHGLITEKSGEKVSKSLNNDGFLKDIEEKYGNLLYAYLLTKKPSEDINISSENIENFMNFITNSVRNGYKRVFGILKNYMVDDLKYYIFTQAKMTYDNPSFSKIDECLFKIRAILDEDFDTSIIYNAMIDVSNHLNTLMTQKKLWEASLSNILPYIACLSSCYFLICCEYILGVPGINKIAETLQINLENSLNKVPVFEQQQIEMIIKSDLNLSIFDFLIKEK